MMRIVVELTPELARPAIALVEGGQFESMDRLVAQALEAFLGEGQREGTASHHPCEGVAGMVAETGHVAPPLVGEDGAPWVWGMVNRVFPLKLVVRGVANLCGDGPISIQTAHARIANCATSVGAILANDDKIADRKRNEKRAVALPAGPNVQKSKVRFAHHYVGRRASDGTVSGGGFEVGLLGVSSAGQGGIAPTDLGWAFASIPNPVLDDLGSSGIGPKNLSDEERRFYLLRLVPQVPAENRAFRAVLNALAASPKTTKELASGVKPEVTAGSSQNVEDTTRSGLLGRMADVGAVVREPAGRSAVYRISDLGATFLDQVESR